MDTNNILKDMKESIGTKDPLVYFKGLTDLFTLLFKRIDDLEKELKVVQFNSTLAIQWDPKLAEQMILDEIAFLRENGEQELGSNLWQTEIDTLKQSYMYRTDMNDYATFCSYWKDLLGYHPFIEKRKL